AAIAQLQRSFWEPTLVTLVHGGALSDKMALTLTEVPSNVMQTFRVFHAGETERWDSLMAWLDRLHDALISKVREAGYRSLSMPTLCTGGVGIPVQFVAVAAARSVYRDFTAHPADPMRVRICCFEQGHLRIVRAIKEEVMDNFYRPEAAEDLVGLLRRSEVTRRPSERREREEEAISEEDMAT
ncbi:unnamed protein product, partial [Effrenium voratum]